VRRKTRRRRSLAATEERDCRSTKARSTKLDLGGGFGRRGGTQDYTARRRHRQGVPGVPVKLIWTREKDQAHDFYRPISQCKLSGRRR